MPMRVVLATTVAAVVALTVALGAFLGVQGRQGRVLTALDRAHGRASPLMGHSVVVVAVAHRKQDKPALIQPGDQPAVPVVTEAAPTLRGVPLPQQVKTLAAHATSLAGVAVVRISPATTEARAATVGAVLAVADHQRQAQTRRGTLAVAVAALARRLPRGRLAVTAAKAL